MPSPTRPGAAEGLAEHLRDDADIRAVIIRATGADFSVGMDLAAMNGGDTKVAPCRPYRLRRTAELGSRVMRALREIPQPVICAVQGVATGGAACIATACDFRIGTTDARIGYGEVKLGINLMWQALPLAIQTVGLARAKRMVMTGALFDAATLPTGAFSTRWWPRADLDAAARHWRMNSSPATDRRADDQAQRQRLGRRARCRDHARRYRSMAARQPDR